MHRSRLLFATHNPGKLREARLLSEGTGLEIAGLADMGFGDEIPETHETLEENAVEKATFVHRLTGAGCFSEDTGLFVSALGGAPGVYSARYAGSSGNAGENVKKLLREMEGLTDRKARFISVIALLVRGNTHLFKGELRGSIALEPSGMEGFGYDPLFIPEGHSLTLAWLPDVEKNRISHRGIAFRQMVEFLEKNTFP